MEQGFSISKELLTDNLQEKSTIILCQCKDAFQTDGSLSGVTLTKSLLAAFRASRFAYRQNLETRKTKQCPSEEEMVS